MKKIVVIGGGTGTFTVLSALKKYPELDLKAIVSMADDGGSTGRLRDELGVLPPGDVRQCLVALSSSSLLLRQLFNYRFVEGSLSGHNFGNLFLSALEKITGSFSEAIKAASAVLNIQGEVVPVTLEKVSLGLATQDKRKIIGQHHIDLLLEKENLKVDKFFLTPSPRLNPRAKKILQEAEVIIIGPGSLYTSLVPNFLVGGIKEALAASSALKIYISNLMGRPDGTKGFCVSDFLQVIEDYIGADIIDYVLYNIEQPATAVLADYERKQEFFVFPDKENFKKGIKWRGQDLLSRQAATPVSGDKIKRSLVRHDLDKLGAAILEIIKEKEV